MTKAIRGCLVNPVPDESNPWVPGYPIECLVCLVHPWSLRAHDRVRGHFGSSFFAGCIEGCAALLALWILLCLMEQRMAPTPHDVAPTPRDGTSQTQQGNINKKGIRFAM